MQFFKLLNLLTNTFLQSKPFILTILMLTILDCICDTTLGSIGVMRELRLEKTFQLILMDGQSIEESIVDACSFFKVSIIYVHFISLIEIIPKSQSFLCIIHPRVGNNLLWCT